MSPRRMGANSYQNRASSTAQSIGRSLHRGALAVIDARQTFAGANALYSGPMMKWQRRRSLITRRGLVYSLLLCLLILGLGGVGFWMVEPRVLTLSDGLWLAFTTAATVGYGDIVPSTPASRVRGAGGITRSGRTFVGHGLIGRHVR
ncbi:potassium channel family protein [Polaromonas sp. P1(28)-13]|nr:potassium channel family protein [Polaromonas sp. P1(28)-13]